MKDARDIVQPMTNTLQDLEARRQELDINKTTMSELVGYSRSDGWIRSVNRGSIPEERKEKARFVLKYAEKHGIVPEPREVKP